MLVQSNQLLHKAGLGNYKKVQTRRQIGQMIVTVTHNNEEGRQDGRPRGGEATRKGALGEEAGPPPRTGGTRWRRWWTEALEGRG